MKRALLLSVFIFLAVADLSAQYNVNQDKVWAFGTNAGVDFTSGSPVSFFAGGINTTEGCASVSDATGSLLFYTDGRNVYNRAGAIMPAGASIVPFFTPSTTQAALIVPSIAGSPNQYYLFSLEEYGGAGTSHLAYSIVDMSLAGGMGDLVPGSIGISMGTEFSEKLTAVAGDNCNVWVLTHRDDSAVFWAYNITAAGISAPVVSSVGSFTGAGAYAIGVIKVSPNRRKIVSQCYITAEGTELYDFDPATGIVSDCQVLLTGAAQYGAEFSPDNTKVYAQTYPSTINQYDITLPTTAAIVASRVAVGTGGSWGDLKLGPDNKIYISDFGAAFLDGITSPNLAGAACGLTTHVATLTAATSGDLGMPNIVVISSGAAVVSTTTPSVCIGDSIKLFSDTVASGIYLWTGPNGFTSTLQDPFITGAITPDSGLYKLVIGTTACVDSDTVTIAVYPYPVVDLGSDSTACNTPSITLASTTPALSITTYLWNTAATTSTLPVTAGGTYWVTESNGHCTASDTLNVTFINVPAPVVTSVNYCQGDVAVPLSATGIGLNWWTTVAGGTGTAAAPTPSTAAIGVSVYFVSSSIGTCESPRVADTVTVSPIPPVPFIAYTSPYCQGQPFMPMTSTGGTVLWWTTPTGGASSLVYPTVNTGIPGLYTYYVSQTLGICESPRHLISITVLDSIVPSFTSLTKYGCKGDTISFNNATSGASSYVWSFGDGYYDTATSPKHIYASQGVYTVTLVASNVYLCADSIKVVDSLIHPLRAAFTDSPLIYCQDSLVTFNNISDQFSDGPLSYTWLFSDGTTSNAINATHIYKYSGVYNVQLVATNFIPCNDTASLNISIDSTSALSLSLTDSVICRGTYATFMGNYTSVGNTGVTWDFGDGDSIKNVNPVAHAYAAAGTYTITVTPHFRACRDTSVSRTFVMFLPPAVSLGGDTAICPGSNAIFIMDSMNHAPQAHWLWSTGETSQGINIAAPGSYWLAVTVNGCTTTDSFLVRNDCYMDIPNGFTPNGDGMNDYFFPRQFLTKGLISFSMNIYNRWGQQVFETTSLDGSGWDGKFNNVPQPEGVYVYEIDARFKDGQKEHHQGNVTLLR